MNPNRITGAASRRYPEERMKEIIKLLGLTEFLIDRFLVGIVAPLYLAMGILCVDFRRFPLRNGVCGALVAGVFFV
jgi:hypothetical protein